MLLSLLVASSAFLSIVFLAVWMAQRTGQLTDARLAALAGARRREGSLAAAPFQQRVVVPLIESIGRRMSAFLPAAFLRRTEKRLVLAGQPMNPPTFYAVMFGAGALAGGALLMLVIAASSGPPSVLAVAGGLLLGVVGMYLVNFWLSAQAKARKTEMLLGLPDSLDLLTICVEAGLGLDAAFHRVAEKQSGPLVDEIRHMLREIGLGKARRDAMLDLCERTDLEDVRTFAHAVIQAEQLGTSLAQVLRVQSERLRVRRRQRAEQEARRAPVKMVFPLVFCLMPSLFIIILGPIIVNVISYLSD